MLLIREDVEFVSAPKVGRLGVVSKGPDLHPFFSIEHESFSVVPEASGVEYVRGKGPDFEGSPRG